MLYFVKYGTFKELKILIKKKNDAISEINLISWLNLDTIIQ